MSPGQSRRVLRVSTRHQVVPRAFSEGKSGAADYAALRRVRSPCVVFDSEVLHRPAPYTMHPNPRPGPNSDPNPGPNPSPSPNPT